MNTIRAILIDPFTREVKEIQIQTGLKHFYEAIGCSLVEVVRPHPQVDCWIDEEGLFVEDQAFFQFEGGDQPLAGRAILCSHDEDGNTTSAPSWLTTRDVKSIITWLGDMADNRPEPVFEIRTW